jgi:hypothetical protein
MPAKSEAPKRGHWPKGKKRNNPRGWTMLLERLKKYVAQRSTLRGTAAAIGVDPRTLGRWLKGEDVPGDEAAAQIRELLAGVKW